MGLWLSDCNFFYYRTIRISNIILANSRNYQTTGYRIKASIYRTIMYQTQKKLLGAHLCSASTSMLPASPFLSSIDWVRLFLYWTGSGIGIFVHSGTGLTECQTVRHSSIYKRGTPCMVERDTPYLFILLAVERDTPCMFILLVVEGDTPCTSILLVWWWKAYTLHTTCPYSWLWKWLYPARPFTDKKENQIFLMCKEIDGAVAK
jgi:hypothetical protein